MFQKTTRLFLAPLLICLLIIFSLPTLSTAAIARGDSQKGNQSGDNGVKATKQARSLNQLKEMVRAREREMVQEREQCDNKGERKALQNQNEVRLTVHALLSMKDLLGGIGPQVSAVASEFNNSVQKTLDFETKIENRNPIVRLFMGDDEKTVEALKQETISNHERVRELERLRNECDCTDEIKDQLDDYIEALTKEQERLEKMAQNEDEKEGIFEWFARLFSFF
jgi:hypothetical protein